MLTSQYKKNRESRMAREKTREEWIAWEDRHIQTYAAALGKPPQGPVLDVGSGTNRLVEAFRARDIAAEGIDFDRADFEKDPLPYHDDAFQTAILNAVIEHIASPDTLMRELARVVAPGGLLIMRTTNWRMDFRNFYLDPTHVRPYVPESLATLLSMYGFETFFSEPALICKPTWLWRLPESLKWHVAKWMPGGTRSMLLIAHNTKRHGS